MSASSNLARFGWAVALAIVLSLSPNSKAQQVSVRSDLGQDRIVIRQTIPDPYAVKRSPLTSHRFSTTSTRLIDARRGFRPYSSVYGGHTLGRHDAAYDDHFGISRPENRPWSYAQRTPRTSVTQFRNVSRSVAQVRTSSATPAYTLVLREQSSQVIPRPTTTIRIHRDRSATPTTSGAVLITSDGTVIQIGD